MGAKHIMSAALQLNFGSTPRRSTSRVGSLLLAFGLLCLALVAYLAQAQQTRYRSALEDSRAHLLANKQVIVKDVVLDSRDLAGYKDAALALDNLSVNWEALFSAIEAAGADGLGVLSVVPDPRSGLVRISADAATLEQALLYVSRLAAQPMFRDVTLSSYQTVQRDANQAIEFVVVAAWK